MEKFLYKIYRFKLIFKQVILKRLLLAGFIIFTLGFSCSVYSKPVWHVKRMVVFGDGDIDNGRSYNLYHIPISPPFWHHRFSNGPTWIETFAHAYGLIPDPLKNPDYNKQKLFLDYGYYFATATEAYANKTYLMSLDDEISQYFSHGVSDPGGTLAIFDIGGNDMLSTDCLNSPMQCLANVSDAEVNGIMRMCKVGIKHFIVISPGTTTSIPSVTMRYSRAQEVQMLQLEGGYDRQFGSIKTIVEQRCPKSSVELVSDNAYQEINRMKFNQPLHIPCYNNFNPNTGSGYYNKIVGQVCSDPNNYFFFDVWFGSYRNNKMYSDIVYKQIIGDGWVPDIYKHWWQRIFS